MKAHKVSHKEYYEVTEKLTDRWWTAAKLTAGNWYICNETGRQITAKGKLGKRILAAVVEAGGKL